MTRQSTFLAILVALLLAVGFYFLLFQPGQEELADVETQIEDVEAQQGVTQIRIAELEAVRAEAASIEAAIAAAASLVPSDAALPATLRQLQAAADDSGLTLTTIAPSPPAPFVSPDGTDAELATIAVNMVAEGSYFQLVDFMRRIEDPALVARGVVVDAVSVTPLEYPDLSMSVTAQIFSNIVPGPDPNAVEEEAEEAEEDAAEAQDGESDEDVEIDVEVDQ